MLSHFSCVWLCVTLWTVVLQVPLATWYEELTHWKRPWCWERLNARGEGNDRERDSWMTSLTRWTWAWASSGSWWWTGVLQSMGLQSVGPDWATELNWWQTLLLAYPASTAFFMECFILFSPSWISLKAHSRWVTTVGCNLTLCITG